uniref:Family with sequence similarity 189 member B n=1 Tax=Varanus komodoensis TaxID=61221 RepID=A0A8D2JDJ6_VARKO
VMPSRSDSSYSLTARTSRSFTHLRVQRSWLQILLLLGFIQMILGVLIVTLSLLVTTNMPSQHPIRSSCPIWAGFPDLLFSVCGLTIFAIVVCTLSAIMCCIQIFSLDVLHALSPPRSSSVTLDCTSPPDTFLHHMLDLDEFVPPVPPPPYYPPEYTCSSETDAQSITYNGSMDSPVPLYPTDFPPSYEAVMGLHGDSQWLSALTIRRTLHRQRVTSERAGGWLLAFLGALGVLQEDRVALPAPPSTTG